MSPGPDRTLDKSQVITVFREADNPALTASGVAEELPVSAPTVRKYLEHLSEKGKLNRKQVGGNTVIWWLNKDALTATDLPFFERKTDRETLEKITHNWPLQLSLSECFVLSSLDIPGDSSQLPERRCAILKAYLSLRTHKNLSKRGFIDQLFPKHQAGYSNANSWWERLIRENLKEFPSVSKPHRGGAWNFDIDDASVTDQSYERRVVDLDVSISASTWKNINQHYSGGK